MVMFYVNKILNSNGEFTINMVPKLWRGKVEAYIAKNENGTKNSEI